MAREARPDASAGREEQGRGLERVRSFSDGVLAIAITLLVLNLDVPSIGARSASELPRALLRQWPDLVAYALGFAVIGRFWVVHHRLFGVFEAVDGRLLAANLVFLGFVALVPFTSDLVATYVDQAAAAMCYGAVLACASLTSWAMARYAFARGFVRADAAALTSRFAARRASLLPGVFAASIPLALISPHLAEASWLVSFAVHPGRAHARS